MTGESSSHDLSASGALSGAAGTLDPQLLLREEDFVRRLARGLLFDDHRVDDVVQQTWLAALKSPPRAAPTRAPLRAWLATVVRRNAVDTLRDESRRRVREERSAAAAAPEPLPTADELLSREEQRGAVVEQLAALPEPYRQIVALRYLEGLSPAEIARRRGVPAATVRTWLKRGLEQLRSALDRRHGGDRRAWCLALIPLARPPVGAGAVAASTGMASPWIPTAAVLMKTAILSVSLAAAVGLLSWLIWSDPAAAGPAPIQPQTAAATRTGPGSTASVDGPVAAPGPRSVAESEDDPRRGPAAGVPTVGLQVGGVSARLLDPLGEPLTGASVRLVSIDGAAMFDQDRDSGLRSFDARTDTDGRFQILGVPRDADCALLADVDGALHQMVPLPVSVAGGTTAELGDIQLVARGVVTGQIVDAEGAAVADAEVLAAEVPSALLSALSAQSFDPAHGALVAFPALDATHIEDLVDQSRALRRALSGLGKRGIARLDPEQHRVVWLRGEAVLPLWDLLPLARTRTAEDGSFELGGVNSGSNALVVRTGAQSVLTHSDLRVAASGVPVEVGVVQLPVAETGYGAVFDEEGEPVVGAEVCVAPVGVVGFRGVAPCLPMVRTDEEGLFEIDGVARGQVIVAARRGPDQPWHAIGPLRADDDLDVELPAASAATLAVELPADVDPRSITVSARPTAPLGELLRMGLVGDAVPHDVELLESEEGSAVLRTLPLQHRATWTLTVAADGCAPVDVCVDLPEHPRADVALRPLQPLTVRVLDVHGKPAADVAVTLQDHRSRTGQVIFPSDYGLPRWRGVLPSHVVRTDEAGNAAFEDLVAGAWLTARDPARGTARVTLTEEQIAAAGRPVELQLSGSGSIVGRIELGRSAAAPGVEGFADLRVLISPSGFVGLEGAPRVERATNVAADGTFRFDHLPVASYDIDLRPAHSPGPSLRDVVDLVEQHTYFFGRPEAIASRTVEVLADAEVTAEFLLGGSDPTLGRVLGQVLVNRMPGVGLEIFRRDRTPMDHNGWLDGFWENSRRAEVAEDGSYEVADLKPGRHWLGVFDPETASWLHVWELEVPTGGVVQADADLQLGRVAGLLLDPNGKPAGESMVQLIRVAEDLPGDGDVLPSARADTDANGRFELPPMPAGRYRISVNADELQLPAQEIQITAGAAAQQVTLTGMWRYRVTIRPANPALYGEGDAMIVTIRDADAESGGHTYVTHDREVTTVVDEPGRFELLVQRNGQSHYAEPRYIEVRERQTVFEFGVGAVCKDD